MTRALLISNSTQHGSGYLEHCAEEVRDFLGAARRVAFVPYALHDRDAYAAQFKSRMEEMGYEGSSVHLGHPVDAVARADAVFIGGGNTFRLLNELHQTGLIDAIRARVAAGMPYLGTSAGSNVACPSLKTTNDMPIVQPPSFEALGLVPFNINAHYIAPDPSSSHMGETRDQRIREFHEMNDLPVVALREGSMLRREGANLTLRGTTDARLFQKDQEPTEHSPGAELSFLLNAG